MPRTPTAAHTSPAPAAARRPSGTSAPGWRPAARRRALGLSLVDVVVATAVTSVALGVTLPDLGQTLARRHLEGQAAQLATDLRLARSLAVSQGVSVRLRVQQLADGACYVLHDGAAGACSCSTDGQAQCQPGTLAWRSAGFPATGRVQLAGNVSQMVFSGLHGTTSPGGTLRLTLADGSAIHHVVGIVGRVRSCSPGARVPGLAACS